MFQRAFSASMQSTTLAQCVHRMALSTPEAVALQAPIENVKFTYAQLSAQVSRLAAALHSLGYRPGDAIASDLPNMHHNLLLQLACCHIGASVATAKDIDNLHTLKQKGVPFKGAVAATTDSFLCTQDAELPLAPVAAVSGEVEGRAVQWLDALLKSTETVPEVVTDPALPAAFFGSATPLSCADVMRLGEDAAGNLKITAADVSCVTVTLMHSFGIATGSTSALMSGATLVLPSAGGIRGCGVPQQRAQVALNAMVETQATLLVGDTHVVKALEQEDAPQQLWLRSGLIKVASGTSFLKGTVSYGGVELMTMGKAE